MTYRVHEKDEINGWQLVMESSNLDDFGHDQDQWAFNFIREQGSEYLIMGCTMWDITE